MRFSNKVTVNVLHNDNNKKSTKCVHTLFPHLKFSKIIVERTPTILFNMPEVHSQICKKFWQLNLRMLKLLKFTKNQKLSDFNETMRLILGVLMINENDCNSRINKLVIF